MPRTLITAPSTLPPKQKRGKAFKGYSYRSEFRVQQQSFPEVHLFQIEGQLSPDCKMKAEINTGIKLGKNYLYIAIYFKPITERRKVKPKQT